MQDLRRPLASRSLRIALALALGCGAARAQDYVLTRHAYEDPTWGYSLRYPNKWDIVPVKASLADLGMILRVESAQFTKPDGGELGVFRLEDVLPGKEEVEAKKDGEEKGDEAEQEQQGPRRRTIPDVMEEVYGGVDGFDPDRLEEDEEVEIDGKVVRHRRWRADDHLIDTWTFPYERHDMALLFFISAEDKNEKRWLRLYEKAAETFETIEASSTLAPTQNATYEQQLAYHQEQASRTPGWRALPTPSEKFILKTSSDDEDFIEEVIERLERSREIFEQDFPPTKEFDHVSVVRICASEEEFRRYGLTRYGVAGYFNPSSTELVLYDAQNIDRNMTFAVTSHEAFHQYCYFLFDRSEAHRWFDEGHGDYYGGIRFKYGKAEITPKMPAGLDRLSFIREMVQAGTYAPLSDHLNFNHQQWQTQGPRNVSCYAQSWSIVYMLRQGALGKVPRKLWKKEYADIIPSYLTTLYEGYQKTYAEMREEQLEKAEEKGGGGSVAMDTERPKVDEKQKKKIWKAAMDASWGKIDLLEFEENWLRYVAKELD